ncbi:hypothetical protein ACIPVK_13375 [Paeniglutamicibacter sp. MACA_103]|uniref:hypothetical protein n=1 Tax=Paeniglutamicibacter sp. MACA_103 TaxID=3377337 RepID=UPI00389646F4
MLGPFGPGSHAGDPPPSAARQVRTIGPWRKCISKPNQHILPTQQKRGLAKTEYVEGTLRSKIFGHDRLPENHPGAAYRNAFGPLGTASRQEAVVAGV